MVYIHSWQEYQDAAEDLYAKSPDKARYCIKWKSSEGKLVLKITDDTTCIKFKTYSSIFLNRFEALNLSLMRKMQNRRREEVHVPSPAVIPQNDNGRASPMPLSPNVVTSSATPSAGIKKKKPKKKK